MTALTEGAIHDALRTVQEPELGKDIITLGMVKDVVIRRSRWSLTIELTTPACPLKDEIERNAREALDRDRGRFDRHHLGGDGPPGQPGPARGAPARGQERHRRRLRQGRRRQEHGQRQPGRRPGPGRGASVGLLDADITGPNIPLMMGLEGQPVASPNNKIRRSSGTG